jgi:hypothetical protein
MYQTGDKVRVRYLNDLQHEFDTTEPLDFNLPYGFNSDMEAYCGKIVTIDSAIDGQLIAAYRIVEYDYIWSEEVFIKSRPEEHRYDLGLQTVKG